MKLSGVNKKILIVNQPATSSVASLLFNEDRYDFFNPVRKNQIQFVSIAILFSIIGLLPKNTKGYGNILERFNCYLLSRKFSSTKYSSVLALHSINNNPYLKYAAEVLTDNAVGIWCSRIEQYDKGKNKKHNVSDKIKYLVFGDRDARFIISLGASKNNVYSYGSPLSNLYLNKIRSEDLWMSKKYIYDICIISQLIDDFFIDKKLTKNRQMELSTIELLLREIKLLGENVKNIKINIALRPQSKGSKFEKNEIDFYIKHLKDFDLSFTKHDHSKFSSYNVALQSKIVVNAHSTLGFELLGLNSIVWFYRPMIKFEDNIINSTDTDEYGALAKDLKCILNGSHWILNTNLNELKREFNNTQNQKFNQFLNKI